MTPPPDGLPDPENPDDTTAGRSGRADAPAADARSRSTRLLGVDAARGLALIGMMTVHVLPGPGEDGGHAPVTTLLYRLAEGRSAALFALLAGVSLVLSRATGPQITVRALLVAALGLVLGSVPNPIAVILTGYGVLFLLALPFLRMSAPVLAGLAAGCAVLSPLVSQWVRGAGLDRFPSNPSWQDLAHPLDLVQNLLLTGYYPALTWLTYLLAGLAVGKLLAGQGPQLAARIGRPLAVTGAVLAVLGAVAGVLVVRSAGGLGALASSLEPYSLLRGRGDDLLHETFYGTTPLTDWWWAGIGAPHSGGIADLVQTTGSALLVLGLALVVAPVLGSRIRALAAAGAMTLTIYTVHVLVMVVLISGAPGAVPAWPSLLVQVAAALVFALAWGAPQQRGPLEDMVAASVRAVAGRRA